MDKVRVEMNGKGKPSKRQIHSASASTSPTPTSPSSTSISLSTIVFVGLAIRLALFLLPLEETRIGKIGQVPRILQNRFELVSPLTSYHTILETHHLSTLSPSLPFKPWNGHPSPSPLLIILLHPILSLDDRLRNILTAILWSLIDVVGALALASAARQRTAWVESREIKRQRQRYGDPKNEGEKKKRELEISLKSRDAEQEASRVAAIYLFHPFVLATCLTRSTGPISNAALLISIASSMNGQLLPLSIFLPFSIHLTLVPILLVPSLIHLYSTSTTSSRTSSFGKTPSQVRKGKAISAGFGIFFFLALGGGISSHFSKGWEWMGRTWGTIILLPDLSPTTSLWWYFFISLFEHFRNFFLLAFNVHLVSYVVPLGIKYRSDPLFAATALIGTLSVFKSYPGLGDSGLFHCCLALFPEIWSYLRHPLLTVLLHVYSVLLLPLLQRLWLIDGRGNANFSYATSLVWAIAGGAGVLDSMWAWGRCAWEREREPLEIQPEQEGSLAKKKRTVIQV